MAIIFKYIQKHYPWLTVGLVASTVFYSLLITVIIKLLWSKRKQYLLSLKLPGPIAFPFVGCLYSMRKAWGIESAFNIIFQDALKYSTPFRVWLGSCLLVVVSNPDDIGNILVENHIPLKPKFYFFWSEALGNGLLTGRGGKMWNKHKKILHPAFSTDVLKSYPSSINKYCSILVDKICKTDLIDIEIFTKRFCSDVIAGILLKDNRSNFQEGHLDHILKSIAEVRMSVHERITKFWLHSNFLFTKSECHRKLQKHRAVVEKYFTEFLDEKKAEFFEKKTQSKINGIQTPIDALIEAQHRGTSLDDDEIIEEIMNIYYAGMEKTSSVLSFFILMMGMHKSCQDRLFNEIYNHYKDDTDASVTSEDLKTLPYLDLCFKEVLRMFPPGAYIFRETSNDIVLKSKNVTIPAGTVVAIPTYNICTNEAYWENPMTFNPERFNFERNKFTFFPFCAGPRACIGENLGSDVVKICMVYLIRKFQFYSTWKMEDLPLSLEMSIRSSRGYEVSVTKRKY